MKKLVKIFAPVLVLALMLSMFAGCSSNNAVFFPSKPLTDEGHFKGVKALDYVTLPEDYAAVTVTKADYEASDEEIRAYIEQLAANYGETTEVTNRAVKDGDTVNMDYVGMIDGVAFDGGKAVGTEVTIGVTNYIDGFLPQIIGHTPGETFDINVTFPEDYQLNPDLAGKPAVFTITLNYIKETKLPVINDKFVADHFSLTNGWNTYNDMYNEIKSLMEENKKASFLENYLLVNSTVSEIPKKVMEYQEETMLAYYREMAKMYSMEFDEFVSMAFGADSEEALIEMNKNGLEESAKYSLIVQAVAEDQDMKITDNEIAAYFYENTGSEDYSQFEKVYGKPYIKMSILAEKVKDFVVENAVIEE